MKMTFCFGCGANKLANGVIKYLQKTILQSRYTKTFLGDKQLQESCITYTKRRKKLPKEGKRE
jgi:hypothetical protein